jgi:hypothetical protein
MADTTDLRILARRAVDAAVRLTSRAARLTALVALAAALVCIGSFALGVAALSEGARTVWIVLGGTFCVIGVGAAVLATWRLTSVRRHATRLVDELFGLIERDPSARRTVIETVEVGESGDRSVVVSSRSYGNFGTVLQGQVGDFPQLARSVAAVTTFPFLMLLSIAVTIVFALLAPMFLLALAL